MTYIKRLIALILSWFRASEPEARETRPTAKHKKHVHLKPHERRALYSDWVNGEPPIEVAAKYNVSMATVYRIVRDYDNGLVKQLVQMREVA